MKTLIALVLTFAALTSAQTVTITMTGVSPAVLTDINTYWLSQTGPVCGTLSAPLDALTTSVTVTVSQAALNAATPLPPVGSAVLITGEPMTVASETGLSMTLTRGAVLPLNPLIAHLAGEAITPLKFASPWQLLEVPIRQWVVGIVQGLGSQSATLGASVTGVVGQ